MKKENISFLIYIILLILIVLYTPLKSFSKEQKMIEPSNNNFSTTHVILINTKLIKNTSGEDIPIIEQVFIKEGKNGIRNTEINGSEKIYYKNGYSLEALDESNQTVFKMNFNYHQVITVPPMPNRESEGKEYKQLRLINPEIALVIPYQKNITKIQIVSLEKKSLFVSMSINEAVKPENDLQNQVFPPPAQEDKFSLLIIASGYDSADMSNFYNRALEVKDKILSSEPFKTYASHIDINIYNNISNLGCYCGCNNVDRVMCCDQTDVISAAINSGYYYDEIIIIHNTDIYCGSGYRDYGLYQTNSYSSYTTAYDGDWTSLMVLHEFGHSFGNLCDEYSYGSENYQYYDCVNCMASCIEWNNLTNECNQGCDAKPSYFRPDDSIMLTLGIDTYNSVSIKYSLMPRLRYFLGENYNYDLKHAILILQMLVGFSPELIYMVDDINSDEKIGNEEAVYIMQKIAELR